MIDLPFTLCGTVQRGKRLGSRLGFPTANIAYQPGDREWPREGVYVGVAQMGEGGERYLAILNQGRHPTAPEGAPTVEAHLIGFPYEPLYGAGLRLSYRHFLRGEMTFVSLEALQAQLERDRQSALAWAELNEPSLLKPTE